MGMGRVLKLYCSIFSSCDADFGSAHITEWKSRLGNDVGSEDDGVFENV